MDKFTERDARSSAHVSISSFLSLHLHPLLAPSLGRSMRPDSWTFQFILQNISLAFPLLRLIILSTDRDCIIQMLKACHSIS
jgi:hypothetical protein